MPGSVLVASEPGSFYGRCAWLGFAAGLNAAGFDSLTIERSVILSTAPGLTRLPHRARLLGEATCKCTLIPRNDETASYSARHPAGFLVYDLGGT